MKNIFRISGVILLILSIFLIHSCKKKEEVPVITTTAVSNITATTATSGGNITSEGSSTVISRGVCWSTGTTPTIADSKTTDAAGAGSFSSNIIDLFGGTTYYVRAYATNSSGTGYGMALSFKTSGLPPSAPTVTAQNATSIQINSAQLNGTVNANYYSTVITFEYGTTTSYGSTATATQSPITGGTDKSVSANITGLSIATIYHYRIKAVNSLGTTNSDDLTFTTVGQVPTVTTLAVTNKTTSGAQLNGTVNANYLSTVVTFEYGTTTSYGSTATATQSPVTGNTNTDVSGNITGLTSATTYHYRIKAVNSLGTTYGSDLTITTLGQAPTVTTLPATNITPEAAQLSGSVSANYLSTVVTFEYGITISYGLNVLAIQSPIAGNTNLSINANISGLIGGTIYHFRIKAENSLGIAYSNDMTFATLGQAPTSTTQTATSISTISATLNGTVNANYLSTIVTFEYGLTTSYGTSVTANQSPVTGNTNTSVSVNIISLSSNTTYHFRVKTVNALGTVYGNDLIFKTYTGTITDIDGNVYYTINIGTQTWMAENVKTTKYANGEVISSGIYIQNNDGNNVPIYGRLYTWDVAVNIRNVCPTGWHIPSDAEWTTLTAYLGGESVAGGKLKESTTTYWYSPNTGATNETGFTALPGGRWSYINGSFSDIGIYGYWWSSTTANSFSNFNRRMYYNGSNVDRPGDYASSGLSVRCLQD